jgi:folate-dependent phosphoribosylglycinamide formyltransferase PurN
MKRIAVFTGNQPRHLALVHKLANQGQDLFVVQECSTLFPGLVKDALPQSKVMADYFAQVREAERIVFGGVNFSPPGVRTLAIRAGDLNSVGLEVLEPALSADLIVVFGSSFIKGELCDRLVEKRTLNIHLGTSPYYRGSACNFWALYDGRPEYVGATVHLLTRGLDSGAMLFHALPKAEAVDGFVLGMKAVAVAQDALVHYLEKGTLGLLDPILQQKERQIRYSKISEFNDSVAEEYQQARLIAPAEIERRLQGRDLSLFTRAFVG